MLNLKRQNGFTLVELMVVVAIIGILSSVAIPQFQTYQAKSRTSEAKLNLAGIYSTQVAFQGETAFYGTCLPVMGFRLQTNAASEATRYYNIGFTAAQPATSTTGIVSTVPDCNAAAANGVNERYFRGSKGGNAVGEAVGTGAAAMTVANDGALIAANIGAVTDAGFRAIASGRVSSSAAANSDRWSINHNKVIIHYATGY